jgi:hypothetical protein
MGYTFTFDDGNIHPLLRIFLESYIFEHNTIYTCKSSDRDTQLQEFYDNILDLLLLSYNFVEDLRNCDGEALVDRIEVRGLKLARCTSLTR